MTASQVVGRNQNGWIAAFWTDGSKITSRVIAAPERDFKAGLLITWGWCSTKTAPYSSYGGDIGATLEGCSRYDGYEPVDAYPLRAFCNRCGAPVSLDEGANGWHHDEPGIGDIMPYREPQPLPGDISKCANAGAGRPESGQHEAPAGNEETGEQQQP